MCDFKARDKTNSGVFNGLIMIYYMSHVNHIGSLMKAFCYYHVLFNGTVPSGSLLIWKAYFHPIKFSVVFKRAGSHVRLQSKHLIHQTSLDAIPGFLRLGRHVG